MIPYKGSKSLDLARRGKTTESQCNMGNIKRRQKNNANSLPALRLRHEIFHLQPHLSSFSEVCCLSGFVFVAVVFVFKAYASLGRHRKNLLNNRGEKKNSLLEDIRKMEVLPFQPPLASHQAAGFTSTLLQGFSHGFLWEKKPSRKYLAVFA